MKIGFMGLGKLGLPCALAISSKGHEVWGNDINPDVKKILETKVLPYREKGADELLLKHDINFDTIENVVDNCDIIFVPIQTPHEYRFEGCTRIPDERDDFNYEMLKTGITVLSDIIKAQNKEKIVIIISTVLPGTVEREILPIIEGNTNFKLCYNPFFIAMGTTVDDFLNPEFVLFGTDSDSTASRVKELYSSLHSKPFYETSIKNAELIKVSYNTFIGMKIVFTNTIMEICHKTGANIDGVMGALKMATDRLISTKYLSGGMGDGGGCVLPDFKIKINNQIYNIADFYSLFHENKDVIYLVESANYSCTTKNNKKVWNVTKRNYNGNLYIFETESGKKITVTEGHLIPVERKGKRLLISAKDIKKSDKLYIL